MNKQLGFGVVEGVMVAGAVVLLAVLGYVFYTQSQDNTTSTDTDTTSTTKKPVMTDDKSSTNDSEDKSMTLVKDAFNTYLQNARDIANSKGDTSSQENLDVFKQSTDASLASKLKLSGSADPVLCSQMVSDTLSYSEPQYGDEFVLITVSNDEVGGSSKVNVRVDTKINKIVSLECM